LNGRGQNSDTNFACSNIGVFFALVQNCGFFCVSPELWLTLVCINVGRCREAITGRLHQLRDMVAKIADLTARLKQASDVLDDVSSGCQQLPTDIGPGRDDVAALVETIQVCWFQGFRFFPENF